MSSRCTLRLLVLAIATALGLIGIPVAPGGLPGPNDTGPSPVQLSSPAAPAPLAVRITRVEHGSSPIHDIVSVAPHVRNRASQPVLRRVPADPPGAFRDRVRALPLAPRAPPLA